jgi:glycosyltransferase involved in cell wall biosynthesis
VRLIEKPNSGAIDALNAALAAARGEICVQLDSDASIETPGWLETMLELMLLDERVGVVAAKVVMDSGYLHACGVDVVGPAGVQDRPTRLLEPAGSRRWHHRVARIREGDGGRVESDVAEVDASIGCCMMFRRADAVAAGGYDTAYSPVWFDDIDLCLGIRRLGRKAFYLPDVRVVHHIDGRGDGRAAGDNRPQRLARRILRRLPPGTRAPVEERLGIDLEGHFTREQLTRFRHHYEYWREKWGWDFNNPDMAEVERRWGGTEICWATDPERRAAGEAIVRTFERSRAAA